jgi:hypothetical protein
MPYIFNIILTTDIYVFSTRSQFNDCWVLIVYQVTVYKIYPKYSPYKSLHFRSCTVVPFQRPRTGSVWFNWHSECFDARSPHFELGLNTLQFSSVSTNHNLKDHNQHVVGLHLANVRGNILIWIFFPLFCCGELTSEVCPSILDLFYICLYMVLEITPVLDFTKL